MDTIVKKQALWEINSLCNFNCPYCFATSETKIKKSLADNSDIDPIINFLNETGFWKVNLIGGEPFLHPRFLELCEKITKKHIISTTTNLASPLVYEFADKIDPQKTTCISCSMHWIEIKNRKLKEDFINKYKYLVKKGFRVFSSFVIWPPLLPEFEKIYNEFVKDGVILQPILFYGNFEGKKYPESYAQTDIESINKIFNKNFQKLHSELNKHNASYKGRFCGAGKDYIRILSNGNVARCNGDSAILGNIYKGNFTLFTAPKECTAEICHCPGEAQLNSLK